MLKITFLGTGTSQGIPVIGSDHPVSFSKDLKDKRLRSSILVQYGDIAFSIDCGPDFRQQMLRADCKKLDAIVFTHEHADHTSGIDDTRPYFFRQGKIPIYLHERVLNSLKERFAYIFDPTKKYPGAPDFDVNLINKDSKFLLRLGAERARLADPDIIISICGEHGGSPESIAFCRQNNFNYVSCSPFRVPVARLAAAQLAISDKRH